MTMSKRLLVIGAGGFVGGFICSAGLERGYDVTAGLRASTSRKYLTDSRLNFMELDYSNREALIETFAATDAYDYIIYNLGATKTPRPGDFDIINRQYLVNVIDALKATGKTPEKFLMMSSLSAMGPCDEKNYTPITCDDTPTPNTLYGRSKIDAEIYLRDSGLPYIIFRATGVYGPRERDYLMMIKSIDGHLDVGMGYKKQMLTFIYVDDLVNAMFDAIEAGVTNKTYLIAEPRAYTQKEFRDIVAKELGGKFVIPLKLPMWAVYGVSFLAEKFAAMRGKSSTLNRDKFKIMKQRNWSCDVTPAIRDFGFHADFPLKRGVEMTVAAYLEEKKRRKK